MLCSKIARYSCGRAGDRMPYAGLLFTLLLFMPVFAGAEEPLPALPAKGQVTMIDLGSRTCIPCQMMAPVLGKLKQAYEGRAVIAFIDVRAQKWQASKYGIGAIPTQIFYTREGTEAFRHAGFMAEEDIINKLTEIGVAAPVAK